MRTEFEILQRSPRGGEACRAHHCMDRYQGFDESIVVSQARHQLGALSELTMHVKRMIVPQQPLIGVALHSDKVEMSGRLVSKPGRRSFV
jgi:hypothetical protein